jgi:hypothetical protein
MCVALDHVVAKQAQAADCTYQCPKRIGGCKSAAVSTNEVGEVMDIVKVPSEGHIHKRTWLRELKNR